MFSVSVLTVTLKKIHGLPKDVSSYISIYSVRSSFHFCHYPLIDRRYNTSVSFSGLEISPGTSPGMCPIMGEYTGRIPDATTLCAKLWSDCRAPELMYYQVSHCESQEVYEEREYQCLGHWREANLLYTYTQRRDVAAGTYECFVGSIITDEEIYINEAGQHCQRNVDPLRYGMKLIKKQPLYSCIERSKFYVRKFKMGPYFLHF